MTNTASRSARWPIPVWLAGLLIAVVLGGSGWLLYRFWQSAEPRKIDSISLGEFRRPDRRQPRLPINKRSDGWISVERPDVSFRYRAESAGPIIRMSYPQSVRRTWLSEEQAAAALVVFRVLGTPAFAKHLNVTPEQMRQLRALPTSNIPLTNEEKSQLEALAKGWDTAAEPAKRKAGQALVDAVSKMAAAHHAGAKSRAIAAAQQAASILTPEQFKLAETFTTPPPAPQQSKSGAQ